MRKTNKNYTYSAREFYTISGRKKHVKKTVPWILRISPFWLHYAAEQWPLHVFWKRVFGPFPMLGKASERSHKVELGHLDYIMQEKMRKMCASWSFPETMKLDSIMKKEYKKLELELLAGKFRVPRRLKEIDSSRDHHQKTNIVSGCPRHLDNQKELDGIWYCEWRLQKAGRNCLHIRRELKWAPGDLKGQKPLEKVVNNPKEKWKGTQKTFVEEGLKSEDDPSSSTLFSERSLAEWFWRLADGSGAKSQRAEATIRLVLDQLISPHAIGSSTS